MNKILLGVILILFSATCFSQPGPPSGPPCWPPPCIPVDGGISVLTIIAAFFGYKFYNKSTH